MTNTVSRMMRVMTAPRIGSGTRCSIAAVATTRTGGSRNNKLSMLVSSSSSSLTKTTVRAFGIYRHDAITATATSARSSRSTYNKNNTNNNTDTGRRWYSSTPYPMESDDINTKKQEPAEVSDEDIAAAAAAAAARHVVAEQKQTLRRQASEYNNARAAYKRQVSKLRHHYKQEVELYAQEDAAVAQADRALKTRRRLERQRAKNERSLENALRQQELQRQQRLAFEDHLLQQQEIREEQQQLHQRARQLVIDDLEDEATLWLTSVEEVETAFADPDTLEQLLWVKPQSVLGVPNPSLDSHFWSYEGHTWDRAKTYKTKAELLLAKLEQKVYAATNISKSVWTADKEADHAALVRKVKLRALIRQAGRKSLLRRQRDYLDTAQQSHDDADNAAPPQPVPVPSLAVLANIPAQEKEGAELLLKDPRQFFVFAAQDEDMNTNAKDRVSRGAFSNTSSSSNNSNSTHDHAAAEEDLAYAGPSLGTPIALRDPLRTGKPQGRVFPQVIGKVPKADMRTEKEKKRQEREERLWAAAQMKGGPDGTAHTGDADDDDLLLAEEDRDFGEAVDYEVAALNWDSDDDEWKKGLDPDDRKLQVPREYRFLEDDIDTVITELQRKADSMDSHVKNTIRTMEEEARSRITTTTEGAAEIVGAASDDSNDDDDDANAPFFDDATTKQLINVGADVEKFEVLMASLSREQLLSLFALEAQDRDVGGEEEATLDDEILSSSSVPSTKVFENIPGLTEQQIGELTELESFIRIAEKQQQQ